MNRYIVAYKDKETGKRRTRVARCSPFADFESAIRQVCEQERLSLYTYVYTVRQGATTYIWHQKAIEAFTNEQIKEYKY